MQLEPTLRLIAGAFVMASVLVGTYVNLFFRVTLYLHGKNGGKAVNCVDGCHCGVFSQLGW